MFAYVTWPPKNISELCLFAAPKNIHGIPGVVSLKRAPKNEHFLTFFSGFDGANSGYCRDTLLNYVVYCLHPEQEKI